MSIIKIIFYNVLSPYSDGKIPKEKIVELSFNKKTTLQELFDLSQESYADISKYYKISMPYYHNNRRVPFILVNNKKLIWEPGYNEIKVVDFLTTNDILDNTILADTGIPQAGGPDIKDIIQLWNEYYPIIDQIATCFGFTSGLIGIGLWVKSLFNKKKSPPPQSIFDLLLSRKKWNHVYLADLLKIKRDDAKKLLQAFGYKWDASEMLYIQQSDTEEIIKKLTKVSFFDLG